MRSHSDWTASLTSIFVEETSRVIQCVGLNRLFSRSRMWTGVKITPGVPELCKEIEIQWFRTVLSDMTPLVKSDTKPDIKNQVLKVCAALIFQSNLHRSHFFRGSTGVYFNATKPFKCEHALHFLSATYALVLAGRKAALTVCKHCIHGSCSSFPQMKVSWGCIDGEGKGQSAVSTNQ